MPSNQSVSPVKRSVSSPHTSSDHVSNLRLSPSAPSIQPHKPAAHKPHRPHLVGTHRAHGRTQSHKNLNKLQRLALAHNLAADTAGAAAPPNAPRHQRKKSAPASPSTSPRSGQSQVRWNQSTASLTGSSANGPVRKNLSTPALRRNGSGILVKKPQAVNAAVESTDPDAKKSVGFKLAASDDEDEWEDHSSISASSTRRNSIVSGKMNGQNSLTSPALATKSPLIQESHNTDTTDPNTPHPDRAIQKNQGDGSTTLTSTASEHTRASGQHLTASRILQQPRSSKLPPAMTPVSATATPAPADRSSRASSFANLASSLTETHSPAPSAPASTLASNPHAASSSVEGGVSRFLINRSAPRIDLRSDSDPPTPSSFLPHYHPRTPPSPEAATQKAPKSPRSLGTGPIEPHSRTQQKLWLQRTATLSNSPPDTFGPGLPPALASSGVDLNYASGAQSRPGTSGYAPDGRRFMMGTTVGAPTADNESKRARKIYERFSTEYSVVHRFHNPVVESFKRLQQIPGSDAGGKVTRVNSARDLANGIGFSRPQSQDNMTSAGLPKESGVESQFLSKTHSSKPSQVRFQQFDDVIPAGEAESGAERSNAQKSRQSDCGNDQNLDETGDDDLDKDSSYRLTEEELLIRRIWESREVSVEGD